MFIFTKQGAEKVAQDLGSQQKQEYHTACWPGKVGLVLWPSARGAQHGTMPPAPLHHHLQVSQAFMLQEGKLRHKGGLEVVGPAFQVLQLQGPSSELIPPSVITAELAMRKVRFM